MGGGGGGGGNMNSHNRGCGFESNWKSGKVSSCLPMPNCLQCRRLTKQFVQHSSYHLFDSEISPYTVVSFTCHVYVMPRSHISMQ